MQCKIYIIVQLNALLIDFHRDFGHLIVDIVIE